MKIEVLPDGMRNAIAVCVCLVAAAFGALAIHRHWGGSPNIAIGVGGLWAFAGSWLGRHFNRKEWQRMQKPIRTIYDDAKKQRLPKESALGRLMTAGGTLLVLSGISVLVYEVL